MRKLLAVIAILGITSAAKADVLLGWDVNGLPAASTPAITSVVNDVNMTALTLVSRGSGLVDPGTANAFSSTSWTLPAGSTVSDAITSNDFITFTATSVAGFTFTATNFAWHTTRSATGPSNFTLRTSLDSFGSDVTTWTNSDTAVHDFSITLDGSFSTVTNVEFRIYGYQAPSSAGSARIANGGSLGAASLDMTLFGTTAAAVPEPAEATLLGIAAGIIYVRRRRKNKTT